MVGIVRHHLDFYYHTQRLDESYEVTLVPLAENTKVWGKKKTCNPLPPNVQTWRFLPQCNLSVEGADQHIVQECLKRELHTPESWEQATTFKFTPQDTVNLECKTQVETRKTLASSISLFSSER